MPIADRERAVLHGHRRLAAAADRVAKGEVLEEGGTVMGAGAREVRVDRERDRRGLVAIASRDDEPVPGHECLDLAAIAGRGDLHLVARVLGEHAEIEQGAGAVREIDDGEGVVEDVRLLAAVALVAVVHVGRARARRRAAGRAPTITFIRSKK